MKSIISTINRIAESMELRNKQEMLRIRNELFTAEREANIQLAKRLARMDREESNLCTEDGADYLSMARSLLNKE